MSRLWLVLAVLPHLALADTSAPEVAPGEDAALYRCSSHTGMVAVTFKPETDLKELVSWVMGFTCKNFVFDPRIVSTGRKVTLIAPAQMTSSEAYRAFLVAISTMGLAVVPTGNMLRIVEAQGAKKEAVPLVKNPDASDQIVRYVVRPSYAEASALLAALAALKSDAGDVQQIGTFLLVTDYASHVREMLSLVALIDVPKGESAIYTIPLQHADGTKLAEKLDAILKPAVATAAPAAKILVDERTNTLIVAASEPAYRRVKALAERLDVSLDIEGGTSIHVYRLGSAIAEELAKTLTQAIDSAQNRPAAAKPGATVAPQPASSDNLSLEGQARVIADKPTNSLIVMSSGRDFLAIRDIIKDLDQPRRQVYIEAVILEVQIGSELDFGASAHGGKVRADGSFEVAGIQQPGLPTLGLDATSTSASPLASLSGLVGGVIGSSQTILGMTIPSYALLFQAFGSNGKTNIISAPSIIAVDNEEAKYKVGTSIPYQKGFLPTNPTGAITSISTNIDHKDLVLELDIKPHISIDDTVLLEIKHSSEDLAGTDKVLGPSWTTRAIETRVVVHDQETVVIGGLMQEREVTNETKVPIVGDIPILGYLFRYSTKTKKKSNLLILLTPYIVKDQLDLEAIRSRKLREHDEFVRSFYSLEHMQLEPHVDYRRKRGMIEEINRSVQAVDDDLAARGALHAPRSVDSGPIDTTPPNLP